MKVSSLRSVFLFCLSILVSASTALAQTSSISGTVLDGETGESLIGANVVLTEPGSSSPTAGSTTDFDGGYLLEDIQPGTYDLTVRFVGFEESRRLITLEAGAASVEDFELQAQEVSLNTVVVTASRQQEKLLDAPASVSVLSAREVAEQPTQSTAASMRNVTGLDMAQTGADRFEIVLRGFNNAFSGAAFSLVDYRQGAVPSLAVNAWILMPISNIDTDRIEIVRGAGSALYGAGVDAGVIHIVTKDPFTHPGTTVAVYGGQNSLAGVNFRHAGVSGSKFGYKISGVYSQVNDWEMDVFDTLDFAELDANDDDIVAYDGSETYWAIDEAGTVSEITESGFTCTGFCDTPRDYDTWKWNLNGMVEYRPSVGTSITFNAGHQEAKSTYGQLRVRSGRFFAQAYLNQNQAGDSYVYGTGTGTDLRDASKLFNIQAQYDVAFGPEQLIFGADFENTSPDTEGTIYGRNEDDDTITEYGAYVQSTTKISPAFDLTLAGRLDYNNIVDKWQFSPRAALVVKPSNSHSFRITYNRAFSSPGNNSLFLDIIAGTNPVLPPDYIIQARGRGARDGFSFRRDESWKELYGSDLIARGNLPFEGLPENPETNLSFNWDTDVPVGMDLEFIYGLVYQGLSELTREEVEEALGVEIPPAVFPILQEQLSPENTIVTGWVEGVLAKPSIEGGADIVNDAVAIDPLRQTTTQTFEVGYKGIINNKLLLAVDVYRSRKEDFTGPLLFESPVVLVPTLQGELTAALAQGITDNTGLAGLLRAIGTELASESLPGPSDPVAIVEPLENLESIDRIGPELLLSYRNFGDIDFWGADLAAQFMITSETSIFATYSFVSDNFFDEEDLDDPGNTLALNAPQNKLKFGFNYRKPLGLTVDVSGRYIGWECVKVRNDSGNEECLLDDDGKVIRGFPVLSGPYTGIVESYFVLDLGVGYDLGKWAPGLRFDLLVQNALDEQHRQFVGAPKLGRFTTVRATYNF
jgi:iron complex outermembrane receptor protein